MNGLILRCLELFAVFFKIGAFTFGGGYAMFPFIQEETISRAWATEAELINFVAVSESTPGPFAVNMATYIGSTRCDEWGIFGSILGSFFATLGVVMPSFIVILIVAKCFEKFKTSRAIQGAMNGLKPTVVGLIAAAVLSVLKTVLFPLGLSFAVFNSAELYISVGIFLVMAVAAFKKVHPILIITASAIIGIALGYAFSIPV